MKGLPPSCPYCGLEYADFKTGLTYRAVYQLLPWAEDPKDGIPKRRGTVLGKWHQIKLEMWRYHLDNCGMTGQEVVDDTIDCDVSPAGDAWAFW